MMRWVEDVMIMMPTRSNRRRLLNALLGPECQQCGERVFPRDQDEHDWYCD